MVPTSEQVYFHDAGKATNKSYTQPPTETTQEARWITYRSRAGVEDVGETA